MVLEEMKRPFALQELIFVRVSMGRIFSAVLCRVLQVLSCFPERIQLSPLQVLDMRWTLLQVQFWAESLCQEAREKLQEYLPAFL